MPMPPPTVTQTSSLVSTVIRTSSFTQSKDEFDEDIAISLGDCFYSKSDKEVVRKGKKRSRDHGDMDVFVTNQIIWTQQSGDP